MKFRGSVLHFNLIFNNDLLGVTYCFGFLSLSMMTFITISNNINVVTSSNISTSTLTLKLNTFFLLNICNEN